MLSGVLIRGIFKTNQNQVQGLTTNSSTLRLNPWNILLELRRILYFHHTSDYTIIRSCQLPQLSHYIHPDCCYVSARSM